MLEITEKAIEKMAAMQEADSSKLPVRISIVSGSSTGPNLGVLCDEQKEGDRVFSYGSLTVIIDGKLLNYCQSITIDFVRNDLSSCSADGGFKITPALSL